MDITRGLLEIAEDVAWSVRADASANVVSADEWTLPCIQVRVQLLLLHLIPLADVDLWQGQAWTLADRLVH